MALPAGISPNTAANSPARRPTCCRCSRRGCARGAAPGSRWAIGSDEASTKGTAALMANSLNAWSATVRLRLRHLAHEMTGIDARTRPAAERRSRTRLDPIPAAALVLLAATAATGRVAAHPGPEPFHRLDPERNRPHPEVRAAPEQEPLKIRRLVLRKVRRQGE